MDAAERIQNRSIPQRSCRGYWVAGPTVVRASVTLLASPIRLFRLENHEIHVQIQQAGDSSKTAVSQNRSAVPRRSSTSAQRLSGSSRVRLGGVENPKNAAPIQQGDGMPGIRLFFARTAPGVLDTGVGTEFTGRLDFETLSLPDP